jgi:hypothetical protein
MNRIQRLTILSGNFNALELGERGADRGIKDQRPLTRISDSLAKS